MTTEAQQLIRLTRLLEVREAPVERLLSAITVAGTSTLFLGVSALTRRLELLVPIRPATLEVLTPALEPGPLPARGVVRISVDGGQLLAAIVAIGAVAAADAMDVAPDLARPAWQGVIEALLAIPGGAVMNRTRFLTDARAAIAIAYPARAAGTAEAAFVDGIGAHAGRVGLTDALRTRWPSLYAAAGAGTPVSVSTECTAAGLTAQLAVLHAETTWDRAIDVAKLVGDAAQAREAAVVFGMLAGDFEIERPRGLEVVLGPDGFADVVVWLPPRSAS